MIVLPLIEGTQAEIMDYLSDGQWHTIKKITKHSHGMTTEALASFLQELVEAELLILGENQSYRFPTDQLETWRASRGLMNRKNDLSCPRYFGGIIEDDGWLLSPLRFHDLVHFRTDGTLDKRDIQEALGVRGSVNQDSDGLIRISTMEGEEIYQLLKDWSVRDDSISIIGVRLDRQVRRRELTSLPKQYVDDLCKFYGSFARNLLRKSMTSIQRHLKENDDIQQQIYLWIIDAVQRYDANTSIPFAAYLHSCLQKWVHDLNRKSYGRAAADNELKYSRAINLLTAEEGRTPTNQEIANYLDEDLVTVEKKLHMIRHINNLRSATTINDDDYAVQIAGNDNPENEYQGLVEQNLLSSALTTSALKSKDDPQVLAWLKVYHDAWGQGTRPSGLMRIETADLLLDIKDKVKDGMF